MRDNILVLEPMGEERLNRIVCTAKPYADVIHFDVHSNDGTREEAIRQANIIIGEPRVEEITRELAPNLSWVQITWAGADLYTKKKELFPKDVILTNATGAFGVCIAEYMIGAILSVYRDLPTYNKLQREGRWEKQQTVRSLEGQTVLVLGAGDIGTEFAKRIKAFGTYVIGVRRSVHDCPDCFDELYALNDLKEEVAPLLARADLVVCCLPNTASTNGLFDKSMLLKMKKGSMIVNVGRGSLISLDDLYETLQEGHLWGAVLDVTNPEPLPQNHPLWHEEHVLITPHIAGISFGQSKNTEEKVIDICCENIKRYFEGKQLKNVVNLEAGYVSDKK